MLTITHYIDVARRDLSASQLTASVPSRYGVLGAGAGTPHKTSSAPAVTGIEPPEGRTGPAPGRKPVVVWNLTRRCNQSCAHCYASAEATCDPDELDTAACRRVLHEMAEAGVPVVIFSGGEPMLRRDLLELVTLASELGVRPQLSSNGTLADVATLTALKDAGLGYFGVSIDGPQPFNDTFRGMPRGWERAVRGLLAGREAGLRTGLRTTVTNQNAADVPTMLELAADVGARRFYVSHLIEVGRGTDVQALEPAHTRELLIELFELARAARDAGSPVEIVTGGNDSAGPLFVQWIREELGTDAASRVRQLLVARGGNSSGVGLLNIDDRGVVHPDQFWRTEDLGDLKQQSFAAILRHPLRGRLARRQSSITGRCGSCRFLNLCGGGHRERALARLGDPWGPDPSCVMTDREVTLSVVRDRRRRAAVEVQA